ncbi:MAG: DUF5719 family protein [Actinomycetota bacterium]
MRRYERLVAAVVLASLVGGALLAERAGPRQRAELSPGEARSTTWICPHGGGGGWTGTIAVANPGPRPVQARISGLGPSGDVRPQAFSVAGGTQVLRPMDASDRGSASVVEVFGGGPGGAWQISAGGQDRGLGVEPCTPSGGTQWYATGMPTTEGERSFLIVTNPFGSTAIVDVTLVSPDAPPVRDPGLTDVSVAPGRSVALSVSDVLPGKASTAAVVQTSTGRIAVGALVVTDGGGVRSTVAGTSLAPTWVLPAGGGAGRSTLSVGVLEDQVVRFSAVLRSDNDPQPAGGLVEVRQVPLSAATYPVIIAAASSVDVLAGSPVVVALSAEGQGIDDAATSGVMSPAPSWLVVPTTLEEPWFPGLVVANPSEEDVVVALRLIPEEGEGTLKTTTLTVGAGQVAAVPAGFLAQAPRASVLVQASGPVVALGASTSTGRLGVAFYALAVGLPVPAWALPA